MNSSTEIAYKEIIKLLKSHSSVVKSGSTYGGHRDLSLKIRVPIQRKIARDVIRKCSLSNSDFQALIEAMFEGKYHEEKTIAAKLIEYNLDFKKNLDINIISSWLNHLNGWEQVDSLCQSVFRAKDLLDRWDEWEKLLMKLSASQNINKRRASLVLFTNPCRQSVDHRISTLAFRNITKLKSEKDILITKAISWLLRSLVKNHKQEVVEYIKKYKSALPSIAIRETRRKISTGRK